LNQSLTISADAAGAVAIEPDGRLKECDDAVVSADTRNLVLRAQAGDRAAFDQLMILHQRLVLSTAARVLRCADDARDAAQEVFLKLYRNLSRIKSNADIRPWLYRVTINTCNDLSRKRRRFPSAALEEEAAQEKGLLPVGTGVEEILHLQERRRILFCALETLPFKERAALVLRDIEGLSTEETENVLGSSATTIRSQIASARVKVKRYCDRAMRRER
jgi:RNA polymerase sigma-70 factor (ECF subfamily)